MSHFYGTLKGQAGTATRRGSKNSGLEVVAASWNGAVIVTLSHEQGKDCYVVAVGPWHNSGPQPKIIAAGVLT
jgi:hypothetical protein